MKRRLLPAVISLAILAASPLPPFAAEPEGEAPPAADAPKEAAAAEPTAKSLEAEKTALHLTFEDEKGITITKVDPGLKVGCKNGRFRIAGRTTDNAWTDEGFQTAFEDPGGELEVTCNYRIADAYPSGLIVATVFTDAGALQICYNFSQQGGTFWIQTAGMSAPHELKLHPNGKNVPWPTVAWGSDPYTFHVVRFHINAERDAVDFWADELLVETMLLKQKITKVDQFSFTLEAPNPNVHYNIRMDDFIVRHPAQKPKADPPAAKPAEKK